MTPTEARAAFRVRCTECHRDLHYRGMGPHRGAHRRRAATGTPDPAKFLWSLASPEQIMAAATTPELRQAAAEKLGVSLRTVQRHAGAFVLCPGPRCMTNVRGGGLCGFCARTP